MIILVSAIEILLPTLAARFAKLNCFSVIVDSIINLNQINFIRAGDISGCVLTICLFMELICSGTSSSNEIICVKISAQCTVV